jgi:hypothetical protein
VLAAVPIASGATTKNHALNATAHMAVISKSGASPVKWAGEVTSRLTRRSAMLLTSTAANGAATGKAILFTKKGTITATTANKIEPQPDGSVHFPGTFKITGGTGKYRGARGGGTFDAVAPANGDATEATLTGHVRY